MADELKRMPAHAIDVGPGETLDDTFERFKGKLEGSSSGSAFLTGDLVRVRSRLSHAAVHSGGHLASGILSNADYNANKDLYDPVKRALMDPPPADPPTLEDYFGEVRAARGPYRRLSTAVSAATGRPLRKTLRTARDYGEQELRQLSTSRYPNWLSLDTHFVQAAGFSPLVLTAPEDASLDLTGGTLALKLREDGTYPDEAVYLSPVFRMTGGIGAASVGVLNWTAGGEGIREVEARVAAATGAASNLALGKLVTASFTNDEALLQRIVNGNTGTNDYVTGSVVDGQEPWVQVDLGVVTDINRIEVWHYWSDGRRYESLLETSIDGTIWKPVYSSGDVFDPANEEDYVETSAGKRHDFAARKARFVRERVTRNTVNTSAHWVELRVYGPTIEDQAWFPVTSGMDLRAYTQSYGYEYVQLRMTLTGGVIETRDLTHSLDWTLSVASDGVSPEAAGLELLPDVTRGEWTSEVMTLDHVGIAMQRLVLSGDHPGGVEAYARAGKADLLKAWKRVPLSGNLAGIAATGDDQIQVRLVLTRLFPESPTPVVQAHVAYTAQVATTTPTVSGFQMRPYVQEFHPDGEIRILLDTETSGTIFDEIAWDQDLEAEAGISVAARVSDVLPFDDILNEFEFLPASGSALIAHGRYMDLRFILTTTNPAAKSRIGNIQIRYLLNKSHEASRNVLELKQDLIRTAFELKRLTGYNQQDLFRIVMDAFEDSSGIDPSSRDVFYDAGGKFVRPADGALDAELVPSSLIPAGELDAAMVTISADLGEDGLVLAYYSTDAGANWEELPAYDLKIALGSVIRSENFKLKLVIAGTARLYGWAVQY